MEAPWLTSAKTYFVATKIQRLLEFTVVARLMIVPLDVTSELNRTFCFLCTAALPNGYLRLTRPRQPVLQSQCPQPCSNPTHCFPSGCHVTCCSFHPTPATTVYHHHLKPLQPPPQPPPSSSCPGDCDSSCLPQCTVQCCWNKQPGSQQDALQPNVNQQAQHLEVSQPEVKQPEVSQPEVNYSNQGYSCPATCPFACYPQCTPECCSTPGSFVTPYCSDDCANLCSINCPQECCALKKSNVHNIKHVPRLTGHKLLLPSIVRPKSPKVTYSYGPKYGALRNPLPVKGFKHGSNVQFNLKNLQAYLKKISLAYSKVHPKYVKGLQNLALRAKGGSLKNTLSFQQKAMYLRPGKPLYKKLPDQRLQATKTFINPTFHKARYSSQKYPGMQAINDLKSKGAPLDIRFAYRYGNRLLVPIDMPNMDIKILRGKKFISVPAFKRTMKEGQSNKH